MQLGQRCIALSKDTKFLEHFKETNNLWNEMGLNSPQIIGPLAKIVKDSKATTIDEFIEYYFYIRETDESELEQLAKNFNSLLCEDFDFVYNCVLYRVFYQTFIGYEKEQIVAKTLQIYFPDCEIILTDDNYDRQYAVDIVIKDKKEILFGVQVKPISYSIPSCEAHMKQIQLNKEKNEKLGVPVHYVYYDKDTLKLPPLLTKGQY